MLMHKQFWRAVVIFSTIVQVHFLQYVVAADTGEDHIVLCVPYRQEAGIASDEITFSNKRLV